MNDADASTPTARASRQPIHPDDLPKQSIHNGYDPARDPNPGIFARLFKSAESKQAQAERLQREADDDAQRLERLHFDLRNLEAKRQRVEDDLANLESQHARFVAGRADYLESHRSNWREGKYLGLGMAEIDFIIRDYPEHRALLVERQAAAEAAIAAFRREHQI